MASRALLKDKEPSEASPMAAGIEGRISPSVLLAIVAVAAVFFIISGLIHLLVRCLLRPPRRDLEDELDGITVLQGQLQHLFHLHDAGVDQSFIDALPVFIYSNVSGSKEASFDCAVCLCEFEPEDRLRLLPRCSHAFHLQCIDTWLLAHSTCPLCRGSLVLDHCPAPAALVLEPSCESFREIATGRGDSSGRGHQEVEESRTYDEAPRKAGEDGPKVETVSVILSVDAPPPPPAVFLPVKLGKFRNVDAGAGGGGEESSLRGGSVDERRCFSMGSFEYVMNETTPLRIAIRPPSRNTGAKRPGHRPAVSDFDGGRSEGLGQFHPTTTAVASEMEDSGGDAENGTRSRRAESLSISNGWLRAMKENAAGVEGGWRRAFSFRLPLQQWRASLPETETSWTEKRGVELELELECAEYGSRVVSRAEETPSFARRTMQWIAGKRPKVVNHA